MVTFLFLLFFPKPIIRSPCQLSKSYRLPFNNNDKRVTCVLDLVHCDLWGPSLITSVDSYRYFVTFVDDFSQFTWLYLLKNKLDFYTVFEMFITFMENQFSSKIKTFRSDNGTEFVNNHVKTLLQKHKIFLSNIMPLYTPTKWSG